MPIASAVSQHELSGREDELWQLLWLHKLVGIGIQADDDVDITITRKCGAPEDVVEGKIDRHT